MTTQLSFRILPLCHSHVCQTAHDARGCCPGEFYWRNFLVLGAWNDWLSSKLSGVACTGKRMM